MNNPRPYVTAALLCERVLQEKNENISIVRIADKIQYRVEGRGIPEDLKPMINLQGFIGIKSGPVTGDHTIKLIIVRPDGDRKEVMAYPVKLLGKDHGQNIIVNMGIGVEQDGLYWFDVLFDEELLTKIPLMVIPATEETQQEQ